MRSLRYLNTMLTVLSVLLALQLWTAWSATPAADPVAVARAETRGGGGAGGIPDEGAQRKEMIDLLKRLSQQMDELKSTLTSGQVRVKLENAPGK